MSRTPTLVLGSTGRTGSRVVQALHAAGHPVRAAARAGPVRFDWTDPATWEQALSGAAAVYLMAPDGQPIESSFVDTAVRLGVRRIVLLSSGAIEEMGDERLLAAERAVRASDVDWTVLRPHWFHQNFSEGFLADEIRAGSLTLPMGELRQNFVDADDIASVAVAVLTGDGHAGQTYELTGPEPFTVGEAAELIATVSGKPVRYYGSSADYLAMLASAGVPDEQARGIVGAFEALHAMGDAEPTDVVERLTGYPPIHLETFARQAFGGRR